MIAAMNTTTKGTSQEEDNLAADLAALGYPGLSYLKSQRATRTPAELVLAALAQENLDSRLVEALPWLVWQFAELDWQWLIPVAQTNQVQNRLGFVVSIARGLAEQYGEHAKAAFLAQREAQLESARLPQEDTLCHASLTQAERNWLRQHRPQPAAHWRLLTDLSANQLDYAA
jgi:hypothetical protein